MGGVYNLYTVEIRDVEVSPAVEEKLWERHLVTKAEVLQVVLDDGGRRARWSTSAEHGTRLLVKGVTAIGRPLFIALRRTPDDERIFDCITAFEPDSDDYAETEVEP
jgi:hypothetical protein